MNEGVGFNWPVHDWPTQLNRMVLYPAILLSIFAPGIWFPEMGSLKRNKVLPDSLSIGDNTSSTTTTIPTDITANTNGEHIRAGTKDHEKGGGDGEEGENWEALTRPILIL